MDFSVIIPVHEYNDNVETLLKKAIESVQNQKGDFEQPEIIFVYAYNIESNIKDFFEKNQELNKKILLVKNENNTDFQSQVNLGVEHVNTSYFVILEFDDELSSSFTKNVLLHMKKLSNIDLYIPFILEVNQDDVPIKLTNDSVWSKQFVGENGTLGFLNVNSLHQYTDFKISGGIFKKEKFIEVGKLKRNIKLTFTYEFLLRLMNNGGKIYSIPKILVKHFATREGSLFHKYSVEMPLKERKFWFDTAKKECNFFSDRVIDLSPINS